MSLRWGGPIYLAKKLEKSCCEEVVLKKITMGLLPATEGQQIIVVGGSGRAAVVAGVLSVIRKVVSGIIYR